MHLFSSHITCSSLLHVTVFSSSAPPWMGEHPYKMGRFSTATRVCCKHNPQVMVMDQAVARPSHANCSPSVENLDEGTMKDITLLERLIGRHLWVGYGNTHSDNVPLENVQNIHNIEYLQTLNDNVCIFLHSDKSYHMSWMRITTRLLKMEGLCSSHFVQMCDLQNISKVWNTVQFCSDSSREAATLAAMVSKRSMWVLVIWIKIYQSTYNSVGHWIALVTIENFQKTKFKRFIMCFKTLSTKKYLPLLFRVITIFWTLPCFDTTYQLPAITILEWHGPPQIAFLFLVAVVGWNDYTKSICEDLANSSMYHCHLIISLCCHVTASLPPLQICHDVLMSARYPHHLLIHVPFMCCQLHLWQKLLQQQWALREVSDISQKASMQPTYHLNVNRLCVLQCGLLQNKRKWGWCIFAYHFCINFFILFTQWIDQKLFWSWWLWLQGTTYMNKQ